MEKCLFWKMTKTNYACRLAKATDPILKLRLREAVECASLCLSIERRKVVASFEAACRAGVPVPHGFWEQRLQWFECFLTEVASESLAEPARLNNASKSERAWLHKASKWESEKLNNAVRRCMQQIEIEQRKEQLRKALAQDRREVEDLLSLARTVAEGERKKAK